MRIFVRIPGEREKKDSSLPVKREKSKEKERNVEHFS